VSALTASAPKDTRLTSPLVVKLGGSVIRSPELTAWLAAIASGDRPVVVVPGGGALADEVRGYQQSLGFGDGPAHRMALLAMDQLAWAVAGLKPGFDVGESEAALFDILHRRRVAVWAPYALIANRNDLPASWSLTSDSLALWLAAKIRASHCYLIKSIVRKGSRASATRLSREGVVDTAFPAMLQEAHVPTSLLGRGDQEAFAACLTGGGTCGTAIDGD
jgi:aspartokinase-like uncharacterized kinase